MPNMLAHIGVGGIVTRTVLPKADAKIILLGCLLPDLPWIMARIVRGLPLGIDPYALRLYFIAQASLFVTLLLCWALATISAHPRRIFAILALNVFLHLFLDTLQTKWANGVHFLAPFSWDLLNFELFWPESLPTYILTLLGLGYVGLAWRKGTRTPFRIPPLSSTRKILCLLCLATYIIFPVFLLDGPLRADNHFVRTIRETSERPGKHVEFDRTQYEKKNDGYTLETFGEEKIGVLNAPLEASSQISARARFVDTQTVEIAEVHKHIWWFRDGSSLVGIVLLIAMWGTAGVRISNSSA